MRWWRLALLALAGVVAAEKPFRQCVWSPSGQSLACGGAAGLYHFTFRQ
jgi:hypothetical protein